MPMVVGQEVHARLGQEDARADDLSITSHIAASHERVWLWVLRLLLPVLILLSARVLYWIWFDNPYGGINWCDIVGGGSLTVGAAIVAVWAIGSWCSKSVS